MKIFVTAKIKSKKEFVEKIDSTHFIVAVNEVPKEGRANSAIAKALAEYFDTSSTNVKLISGFGLKQKTFDIE